MIKNSTNGEYHQYGVLPKACISQENLNSKKDTLDFNWTVNKDDLHNEAVWTVI